MEQGRCLDSTLALDEQAGMQSVVTTTASPLDDAATRLLTAPPSRPEPSGGATAFAADLDHAIAHLAWVDRTCVAELWDNERLNAEVAVHDRAIERAIDEPSATLEEIAAKARLALNDFDRFHLEDERDRGEQLLVVVLKEAAEIGARSDHSSPALVALLRDLEECEAKRAPIDIDEDADAKLFEHHWSLRERIGQHPAGSVEDLRLKARAAQLALKWDSEAQSKGAGSFVGLAQSVLDDLVTGIGPAVVLTPADGPDLGPDAEIAATASQFCAAYVAATRAERAYMADEISEAEWQPLHDAAQGLMDQLSLAEPKTIVGMGLKCLAIAGSDAWGIPRHADPDKDCFTTRIARQFETAILDGGLSFKGIRDGVPAPAQPPAPQNAAPALSALPVDGLWHLAEAYREAFMWWGRAAEAPWARDNKRKYRSAAGDVAEAEYERHLDQWSAVHAEATRRQPANNRERDKLLEMRISHEMECNGRLHDPALLADISQAWGGRT